MAPQGRLHVIDGEADTAAVAAYERSRRDLVRRGLVLGAGVVAAVTIPSLLRVRTAFAQAEGDAGILVAAIGLEQTAVVAYDTAVGTGLLDSRLETVARLFREQEQEHADGLRAALEELGGRPPAPPRPEDIEGLGDLRDQAGIARFAIELETMAVAAYYDAHQKLQDPKLLQTGASIMANEGQHLVVLRQALGIDAVPDAFETGAA